LWKGTAVRNLRNTAENQGEQTCGKALLCLIDSISSEICTIFIVGSYFIVPEITAVRNITALQRYSINSSPLPIMGHASISGSVRKILFFIAQYLRL
jgi:hypothetical protein